MKSMTLIYVLMIICNLHSQSIREIKSYERNSPEEIVSLSGSASFDQAMKILGQISKQTINKIIICEEPNSNPIGIDIDEMNWFKAFQLILRTNDYEFTENHEYIKVIPKKKLKQELTIPDILKGVDFETREVAISAIFFEMNVNRAKEIGIDWKWLLSKKGLNIGSQLGNVESNVLKDVSESAVGSSETNFQLGANSEFQIFKMAGKATVLFNFFESQDLGEIIASPQITVRDQMKGEIQVGADYSTRIKDFAGNTIERFFSTGTIIRVTPYVLDDNGKNYILIDLAVERSSANPGQLTTEVKRTKAETNVLLLDGEETVIGGLYINEERNERNGIPILKDLPWWVFGIRYLTGSDATVISKKELIIVLKAKLLPTLQERLTEKNLDKNIIREKLDEYDSNIQKIRTNQNSVWR